MIYCKDCAWLTAHQGKHACYTLQKIIEKPDTEYCAWGLMPSELIPCDICKTPIYKPVIAILDHGKAIGICHNCYQKLGTCALCKHSDNCAFDTDPSPLPKMVQKQVSVQGGYAITTIRNPDRVAITCEKNCKCYNKEEQYCMREDQTCINQEIYI